MAGLEPHRLETGRAGGLLLAVGIGLLVAGAGFLVWRADGPAGGIDRLLPGMLPASGVANPVTAVLLNFRGYDTLLEITVLLAAVIGVWSLGPRRRPRSRLEPDEILFSLVRILLPLLILVSGFLVWVGSKAPGGAFQAGALLGAAGVLLLLVDCPWPVRLQTWLRPLLGAGPLLFLGVAGGVMAGGRNFLQYPLNLAGGLILLVETVAALSIGLALALLFAGGRPEGQ